MKQSTVLILAVRGGYTIGMKPTLEIGPASGLVVRAFVASLVLLAIIAGAPDRARAVDYSTPAPFAYLIDVETRAVLLDKRGDEAMPPASLAKLMTIELVLNALQDGRLSMSDKFLVSEKAWRMRGSRMFAEINSEIEVENLLRGIIVQSGNDAAVILAEGMAGTEEAFADLMNARADELGLTGSRFVNATGWPAPEQRVTARDMAMLAIHIIETYPEYYPIFAEEEFIWNGVRQRNRNPLLSRDVGADGLKTGHTEESGYAFVGSAVREGRRMVLVVSGLDTARARSDEAFKLLQWGLRTFSPMTLYNAGEAFAGVAVFGGEKSRVSVGGEGPVKVLVERGVERHDLRGRLVYDWPLEPPVRTGDQIARLRVTHDDRVVAEIPLYATEDVDVGPLHRRALDSALEMVAKLLQ